MTIDKSAIQELTQLGAAPLAADAVNKIERTVLVPDNCSVVDIEQYLDGRTRYRGVMSTPIVDDFADYTNEHSCDTEKASCYINIQSMSATAFLNLGNLGEPGHGDHKAKLSLVETAGYSAVLWACSETHTQKGLAEWVEDWHANIAFKKDIDSEDYIALSPALASLRALTIEAKKESTHRDSNMSASRSTLEEIDVNSREGNMPGVIEFTCKPFEALSTRTFVLRISVLTSHEKPMFKLRMASAEAIKEDIGIEFKDLVVEKLDEKKSSTFIGEFSL